MGNKSLVDKALEWANKKKTLRQRAKTALALFPILLGLNIILWTRFANIFLAMFSVAASFGWVFYTAFTFMAVFDPRESLDR